MKKMKNLRRIVSLGLMIVIILSVVPSHTSHAWKLNTHVYSGNIILDDLLDDGHVTIEGLGTYKVPTDIYDAISKYPNAYRAGTLGPDIYPEMATGQGVIHAKDSGKHLELLMDAYTQLPVTHPEREKIYAFILGYATHFAGDLFGHDFINEWAQGVFPGMEEMAQNPEEAKIALRHIATEGYIDKKIFELRKDGNDDLYNLSIDAPKEFIKDVLLLENAKTLEVHEFVKTSTELMDDLRQYSENNKAYGGNIFEYAYKTNAAGYADRWAEDIDKALYEMVNTHEKMAKDMLDPNKGASDTVARLENWVKNYGLTAMGSPDTVANGLGVSIDTLMDILIGITPDEIREKIKKAKEDLIYSSIEQATGVSIHEVIDTLKHPERACNDIGLFETGGETTKLIDEQIGNFAVEHNPDNMDFLPFKNTITMGKLILLGSDTLNGIFPSGDRFYQQECTESFDEIEVYIHTQYDKDSWLGTGNAGTDNDIFFFIKYRNVAGEIVEYKYLLDKPGYNDFERGDKDTYVIKLPERIGYEQIVAVGVESRKAVTLDEWQPEYISIYVKDAKIIAASGPNAPSGDSSFKKTYDYNGERWTAPNNILFNEKVRSGYASFDPKVVSFIYSLDEGSQWENSSYYQSNQNKWNQIFSSKPSAKEINVSSYFEKIDRINITSNTPDYNKNITFHNVSNWATSELRNAVNNGLYNEQALYNNCKRNITRKEFATVAVNVYKSITGKNPEPASVDTFMDTTDTNVLIAYALGIINGKGKDTTTGKNIFSPDLYLTRQEMAKIMENTIKALGISYDTGTETVLTFGDTNKIANWAMNSAKFAYKNRFIKGDGVNFNPLDNTPVEQAVIIANRFFEKYKDAYPKTNKQHAYSIDILEENLFNSTNMMTYGKDTNNITPTDINKYNGIFFLNANGKNMGVSPFGIVLDNLNNPLADIPINSVYNTRIRFGNIDHEVGNGGFIFAVESILNREDGCGVYSYYAGIEPNGRYITFGKGDEKWNCIAAISIPEHIDLTQELEFTMVVQSEASSKSVVSFYINREYIGKAEVDEDFSSMKSMAGLKVWNIDMIVYDFDILSID